MDPRTWPLSAAASQRLLDLDPERRRASSDRVLMQLTVKDLLLRGALRIDEVQRVRRRTRLLVSTVTPPATLPPATSLLASKLSGARHRELTEHLKAAIRRDSQLPRRVREAAEQELLARGLIEQRERKVLGLFPQRFWTLTASGSAWQSQARELIDRIDELAGAEAPPPVEAVESVAPLLPLSPDGLSLGARTAARRRLALGSSTGSSAPYIPTDVGDGGDGGFFALDGLDAALGGVLDAALDGLEGAFDGLDAALDSLDGALGSIDSALDSIDGAIDASVGDSGGGGDGGGGDGGGGGGD